MDHFNQEILATIMSEAYPEPTEEEWDEHIIAQFEEQEQDRFSAQPESEV
jgi:hypothetical protein